MIAVAADAIISIDESQTIKIFNDGAQKIFGWSREEVLGKPLDVLLPERFRASHRRDVHGFGEGKERARKMAEHRAAIVGLRKSGEEFPADAAISRVRDGAGWLYTVVLRDITEQKRVEHEQRFLADVGPVLANSLDYDETVRRIAELAVRDIADLCIVDVADEDDDLRRFHVVSRDATKAWLCELLRALPIDRRRPHLMTGAIEARRTMLLDAPSPDEIASLAQDDAHRRALLAAEIRSMVAIPLIVHEKLLGAIAFISSGHAYGPSEIHLAQELAERAALAIESARLYRMTERALSARDQILGIVAHDLRNPLAAIRMQTALLRRRPGEPCSQPAALIERAAARMQRMIEDLLDIARIEAGQLSVELARVSARQVLVDSIDAQKALAASLSLELDLEVHGELGDVLADRERLLQVFENLVGNAMKFTPPGGRISLSAVRRENDVLFSVRDTGAGISGDDLPHVFDRFWQAQRTGRRGAGLGLSIVKGVVDAHHGRVWVESAPNVGSTVHFCIPTWEPRPD